MACAATSQPRRPSVVLGVDFHRMVRHVFPTVLPAPLHGYRHTSLGQQRDLR